MSNILLEAAKSYVKNGLCVIATNAEKRPAVDGWKEFQKRLPSVSELTQMFGGAYARGLAVICGKVSGGLEVIDIDTKYDVTGKLWDEYSQAIRDNDEDLFYSLMIMQTISGGYHLYYKCATIAGNQKLANRGATARELANDPNDKVRVLIETRGEGGYVVAPPTGGYKKVSGEKIPDITVEQRTILLDLARLFNEEVKPPLKPQASRVYNPKEYGLSPFEDYNKRGDVVGLLQNHGWTVIKENEKRIVFRRPGKTEGTSGDILLDKMWFKVFTTSSQFEAGHAYLPYAVYAVLECQGDFKTAFKKLLDAGYGERREFFGDKLEKQVYKKKMDGQPREELVNFIVTKAGKSAEEAGEILEKLEKIWGEKLCTFWDVSDSGKLSINRTKLLEFLHMTGGFSLYYYDSKSIIFKIVQMRDGFIEDVSTEHVKKFVLNYIDSLPETFDNNITPDEVKELVLKGSDSLFSKPLMEFLSRGQFDFLKDTATEAFFTFKNGIVRVTKETIELKSYAEMKKVIWRSQIVDFDIQIEPELDFTLVEYMQFIDKISGEDSERRDYALTLIGYLLHKYKDPTQAYAVILAEETENEKEGGGTGKGIFFKAISRLINTVTMDGKAFKQDKSFAFQRVDLDTKLVIIEDTRKNVDFEGFYPMITEGMTVEKKNKDELFIPYADSPKIGFTTNYNVNAVGNHGKRRQKVFEFAPFFKPSNTPEEHFGHKLFDDWDNFEWNRFYNMMFICVQSYLQDGVKEVVNSEKLKRKQVRVSYGDEMMEWWDEFSKPENGNLGVEKMQMAAYNDFINENGFTSKDYSVKRFKSALTTMPDLFGLSIKFGKHLTGRWFILGQKHAGLPDRKGDMPDF